jgi:NADH-ubiquinone oxidoreductase chain 6
MLYLLFNDNLNDTFIALLTVLEAMFLLSGLAVIISKNPILSVLFLIALFLFVSIYLILIGIYFIGISYLLVYIGAVSILFLFILMLIDIRISELHSDTMNSIILAIILGITIYIPVNLIFVDLDLNNSIYYLYDNFFNMFNKYVKYISHNT